MELYLTLLLVSAVILIVAVVVNLLWRKYFAKPEYLEKDTNVKRKLVKRWIVNFDVIIQEWLYCQSKTDVLIQCFLMIFLVASLVLVSKASAAVGQDQVTMSIGLGVFFSSLHLWITWKLILYLDKKYLSSTSFSLALLSPLTGSSTGSDYTASPSSSSSSVRSLTLGIKKGLSDGLISFFKSMAINPISKFDRYFWWNYIDILVIIIEFFQLLSFPLLDLHTTVPFINSSRTVRTLLSFIQTGQPGVSPELFDIIFMTTFGISVLFSILAIILILLFRFKIAKATDDAVDENTLPTSSQDKSGIPKPFLDIGPRMTWIFPLQTLVRLLYLPLLASFVSVMRCLVDWQTPDFGDASESTRRCYNVTVIWPVNASLYAMFGYILLYPLATWFLTSAEGRFQSGLRVFKGKVEFSSFSVVVVKNASLLLVIVYLLLRSSALFRGIVSIFILLILCIFQIFAGSCYVQWVNDLRTVSFISILYTSSVVAFVANRPDTPMLNALGYNIYYVFVGGWLFIALSVFLLRFTKSKYLNN